MFSFRSRSVYISNTSADHKNKGLGLGARGRSDREADAVFELYLATCTCRGFFGQVSCARPTVPEARRRAPLVAGSQNEFNDLRMRRGTRVGCSLIWMNPNKNMFETKDYCFDDLCFLDFVHVHILNVCESCICMQRHQLWRRT